jgi:homoserine O-succinyltransferase
MPGTPGTPVIDIGLVNNMPDAALDATERQFRALLSAAAGDLDVRLTLYSLPEVPRTDFGRRQVSKYADIEDLWDRRHDGLIVTGTEPKADQLTEEPYWGTLTRLLEWADRSTYSTILSCLAAHAGILHIDGIARRPLGDKRFGVFECVPVSDHPLTAAAAGTVPMPHSRWNDIPEEALLACGYRVLMRSDDAGVDTFVKQRKSLFVFFQGHPEYDAVTLLLEYRRDVARYLRAERDTYPPMPRGYFDPETERQLAALRERALGGRDDVVLADFPTAAAAARVTNNWRSGGEHVYRNWLGYIAAAKQGQLCAA